MKFYAEIGENGKCYHVTTNPLPLSDRILEVEEDVIGKIWTGKEWIEDDTPILDPEPTEEEIAQAEMLLMQTEILANQNAQDEVLAEILLNQMEV